jgi:DNA-binding HxlR family transcriptional regulator
MAQITNGDQRDGSIAIDLVGERWTLLILREAFAGTRRWADFLEHLEITSSVLAVRLRQLMAAGLLERVPYQDRPQRSEYHLTAAGRELWPIAVALMAWGEKHGVPSTLSFEHAGCGGPVRQSTSCERCRSELSLEDVLPQVADEARSQAPKAHDHQSWSHR